MSKKEQSTKKAAFRLPNTLFKETAIHRFGLLVVSDENAYKFHSDCLILQYILQNVIGSILRVSSTRFR